VHIIPAAGSATRMGGIPKYLLPVGEKGTPLIKLHIEMALNARLDTVVAVHPSLYPYICELISSWSMSSVKVVAVVSPTMTTTVKEAVNKSKFDHEIVSVSMPDTYFSDFGTLHAEALSEIRRQSPCLGLWRIQQNQIGKLGQVDLDKNEEFVVEMVDKDASCSFPYSWGMMSFSRHILDLFDPTDSHVGISLKKHLENGLAIRHVTITGKYFDCGTPFEYFAANREVFEL
jgi:UTP-glucose-1-phosphate uridylyltransferase